GIVRIAAATLARRATDPGGGTLVGFTDPVEGRDQVQLRDPRAFEDVSRPHAGEAERMGMRISDMELSLSLRNTPAFQREGRFDQELYFQAVRYSFRTSPEQFEREQRRMMLSAKLKAVVARSAKVTAAEIREEYARVNGSAKDFEKKREEFSSALRQRRAVEGINAFLRQLAGKEEIRSFLEQREQGG
ncbi:MAG: SurA N-terminal domain-containing protein, partial [Elusimicrobiota bacterium]